MFSFTLFDGQKSAAASGFVYSNLPPRTEATARQHASRPTRCKCLAYDRTALLGALARIEMFSSTQFIGPKRPSHPALPSQRPSAPPQCECLCLCSIARGVLFAHVRNTSPQPQQRMPRQRRRRLHQAPVFLSLSHPPNSSFPGHICSNTITAVS